MKTQVSKIMVLLGICIFLSSCIKNEVYNKYYPIKNEAWQYADSVVFEVPIEDTAITYDLDISIRHDFNFDWRNIWVKVATQFPDGTYELSSVNLPLSEADGIWFGKCSGNLCNLMVQIQNNAKFPEKGNYRFVIYQDMRMNPLEKIHDVGLILTKHQEKK